MADQTDKEADIHRMITAMSKDKKRPDPYADIELDPLEIERALNVTRQQKALLINDDSIEIQLTEDEIDTALRTARRQKSGRLYNIEYTKRLGEPLTYPKYTTEQFGVEVLNNIKRRYPNYVIDNENELIWKAILLYFTGNDEFLTIHPSFSFDKGIAIRGPIGCGKTLILRSFCVNPTNSFRYVLSSTIADEYTHKEFGGQPIINKYSTIIKVNPSDYWGQREVGLFIDDVGIEDVGKHYGNEKNVLEHIFQNRYANYELRGKTHLTTNLSADQLEEMYGPRVRSRMREMFNWLSFDNTAKDRRK